MPSSRREAGDTANKGRHTLNSELPIFVVGMQRSGTTLLQSILTAHPNISIAPETHFLNKMVKTEGNAEEAFKLFWSDYTRRDRFRSLNIDPDHMESLIRESGDLSFKNVFRTVLMQYATSRNKSRWGEKTPSHYAHLEQLLTWFPRASIIVVVRDPRAVCCSLLSVYWRRETRRLRNLEGQSTTRFRRIYHDAQTWQLHVQDLVSRWTRDERVLIVRYEDLVSDPQLMLTEIFTFLREPVVLDVLADGYRADTGTVPDAEHRGGRGSWRRGHLARASGPITTDSIDKWKEGLLDSEIMMIEKICRIGMGEMRYDAGSTKVDLGLGRIAGAVRYLWCDIYWRMSRKNKAI